MANTKWSNSTKSVLVVLALALACAAGQSFLPVMLGQGAPRHIILSGGPIGAEVSEVSVVDLDTGERRVFFRPHDRMRVFDYSLAPEGDLVAVREQLIAYDVPQERATFTEPSRSGPRPSIEQSVLRILTLTGSEVDSIEDVRAYAWSPDGQQVAYVTGKYRGNDREHTRTGTWVWDALERRRQQISSKGYFVNWAKFDQNIYSWDPLGEKLESVTRYNRTTRQMESTRHKSIYFAPSGRFYYHPGGGLLAKENVYDSATDVGLDATSSALAPLAGWRPLAWAPDRDVLLIEANRKNPATGRDELITALFDPSIDTLSVVRPDAVVAGWGTTGDELVVKTGELLQVLRTTDVAVSMIK